MAQRGRPLAVAEGTRSQTLNVSLAALIAAVGDTIPQPLTPAEATRQGYVSPDDYAADRLVGRRRAESVLVTKWKAKIVERIAVHTEGGRRTFWYRAKRG